MKAFSVVLFAILAATYALPAEVEVKETSNLPKFGQPETEEHIPVEVVYDNVPAKHVRNKRFLLHKLLFASAAFGAG